MNQRTRRKNTWLIFSVFVIFVRGLPGWGAVLANESPETWLPSVTLAFLWGALGIIGFLGATSVIDRNVPGRLTIYQLGMTAVFVTIPVVGLVFLNMGYDFVTVGVDIIFTPLVLALWLYATKQRFGDKGQSSS